MPKHIKLEGEKALILVPGKGPKGALVYNIVEVELEALLSFLPESTLTTSNFYAAQTYIQGYFQGKAKP